MNILKTLRKPYLSIFLTVLTLFVSCNQDATSEGIDSQFETISLKEFVTKHIELTSKMSKHKNSLNFNDIEKLIKSESNSDTERYVQDKEIDLPSEIIAIQLEMIKNAKIFYNNPEYNSFSQDELLDVVTNEIKIQLENNGTNLFTKSNVPCLAAFNSANEDCLTALVASLATATVVGLFTSFGVETAITGGIALLQFGECNEDAQANLADCRENQ